MVRPTLDGVTGPLLGDSPLLGDLPSVGRLGEDGLSLDGFGLLGCLGELGFLGEDGLSLVGFGWLGCTMHHFRSLQISGKRTGDAQLALPPLHSLKST